MCNRRLFQKVRSKLRAPGLMDSYRSPSNTRLPYVLGFLMELNMGKGATSTCSIVGSPKGTMLRFFQ